jgi:hypothetical protein
MTSHKKTSGCAAVNTRVGDIERNIVGSYNNAATRARVYLDSLEGNRLCNLVRLSCEWQNYHSKCLLPLNNKNNDDVRLKILS